MQDESATDRSPQYMQSSPIFAHRDESKVSRPTQRRSALSRTPADFYRIMLESGTPPPTTFAVVQELVGVVAEYCTPKECVDTLQLVSHTWRRAVLDIPQIREAYINSVSRRNNEIEGDTAPMRTYAKLNASIMLIVWLCVYPWVFLVWAGIPTAATKHNFDGVLVCFILALTGCGVGMVVAVVLTIVWLVQRAPLYTKSRCVQGVAHIFRDIVLTACTVAGIVCLTRYQSAWAYNRNAVTQVAECPRAADAPWPTYVTFADPGVRWHVGPKKSVTTTTATVDGPDTFTTVWWNVSYTGTTYPASCRPEHARRAIGSLNSSYWKEDIAVAINFNVNRVYFDVVAPNTTLQVATDAFFLTNDGASGRAARDFRTSSYEWTRSRVALATSFRAPLGQGEFWLMALLWAYVLPTSLYLAMCMPELLYWAAWLFKRPRQRSWWGFPIPP